MKENRCSWRWVSQIQSSLLYCIVVLGIFCCSYFFLQYILFHCVYCRLLISQFIGEHCLIFQDLCLQLGFPPFTLMIQRGSSYLLPENRLKQCRDLKNCSHVKLCKDVTFCPYSNKCPHLALQEAVHVMLTSDRFVSITCSLTEKFRKSKELGHCLYSFSGFKSGITI